MSNQALHSFHKVEVIWKGVSWHYMGAMGKEIQQRKLQAKEFQKV